MSSPVNPMQQLAAQEAQNQQVLASLAQREGQAAAQLSSTATTLGGADAIALNQLAAQELQNQQILQQTAQLEAQAAQMASDMATPDVPFGGLGIVAPAGGPRGRGMTPGAGQTGGLSGNTWTVRTVGNVMGHPIPGGVSVPNLMGGPGPGSGTV